MQIINLSLEIVFYPVNCFQEIFKEAQLGRYVEIISVIVIWIEIIKQHVMLKH